MPGYVIHLAACNYAELGYPGYQKGILAPDILKEWYKTKGSLEAVHLKYDQWKTTEMPEFELLAERINQKERLGSSEGLHYGLSTNPDIEAFMQDPNVNISIAFWSGYHDHLYTAKKIYQALKIDQKFSEIWEEIKNLPNAKEIYRQEVEKLHNDWDVINKRYLKKYNIVLPWEVFELDVVKFKDGETTYVDVQILDEVVEDLRREFTIG